MYARILLCLSLVCFVACDDPIPSQEEAREAYNAHQALLDQLDTDLRAAVSGIPWTIEFRCQPDEAAMAALPPEQQILLVQRQCEEQRSARANDEDIAVLRFRDEWLPQRITGGSPLVGLHVSYVPVGVPDQEPTLLGERGPTNLSRRRLAESGTGERIGERMVEWGTYQAGVGVGTGASAAGEGDEAPGLRVHWNIPHGRLQFEVTAMLAIAE